MSARISCSTTACCRRQVSSVMPLRSFRSAPEQKPAPSPVRIRQAATLGIDVEAGEAVAQLFHHARVHGVARLRPVHRDDADAILANGDFECFVGHPSSRSGCAFLSARNAARPQALALWRTVGCNSETHCTVSPRAAVQYRLSPIAPYSSTAHAPSVPGRRAGGATGTRVPYSATRGPVHQPQETRAGLLGEPLRALWDLTVPGVAFRHPRCGDFCPGPLLWLPAAPSCPERSDHTLSH